MRRITRIIKMFMRSRDSWKTQMPSGFCISVLIDECYKSDLYRDDVALYDTMAAIRDRLSYDKTVAHPTRPGEYLTKTNDDSDIGFLLDKLNWALEKMSVLHESDCSEVGALKAWKAVFDHKFFSGLVEEAEDKKAKIADSLRSGNQGVTLGGGLAGISAPGLVKGSEAGHDQAVKTTRAFGGKDEAQ